MDNIGKTALVVGATGLIGSHILELLINNPQYSTVYVAGRRKPAVSSPKLVFLPTEITQMGQWAIDQIDDIYCTLGTTIKKAKSQEAFRMVDFDAVVELGQWAKTHHANHFAVVSSIGANAATNNFYLKTKGQMEQRLKQLGLPCLIIVRPSLLLGKRAEIRLGEKIGEIVSLVLDPLLRLIAPKYRAIKAEKVARAMVALCETKQGDTFIVESHQLQSF